MAPPSLQVSRRGLAFPASPIRKLAPFADEAKKKGRIVYGLNIGQPDLETPAPMRAEVAKMPKTLAYSPSGGTAEVVRSLLGYYARIGFALRPDQLLTTTGGSEAILFTLLATCDAGDEVLVPEPMYANYRTFAMASGVRVVPIPTRAENGFHLPPRAVFEAACTANTRAVLLCNPCNPTGAVYTRAELEDVAQLCRERNLFLLVDEVYREFAYDGKKATSALSLEGMDERVVVIDSLSKRYGACGIRLGCMVTKNAEVFGAGLRLAQARLSPPLLAQMVALGADALDATYFDGVITEYQKRRDVLYRALKEIPGVVLEKPEGAFYFVARLPVDDAEKFARFMLTDFELDNTTVMVAPAAGFYMTEGAGVDEVRIAYVLEQADLEKAARALAAGIAAYRAKR